MAPKQSLGNILCLLRFLLLSPQTKLGDLLFLHRFLLHHPERSRVTYCYSTSLFHYYYYSSSTHFCLLYSISRRCLDQTLWNLVRISYAMWSCAFKGWFFQNGCRCHGNGQNAKKFKNTKMIIAGYSPNRNWWNLIGTTSTSSGTR